MPTIGETLRQARLDKGVSLADAERDTRIRRKYLEALEAEDAASLPSPVYTRGFVRTYAEYLGLNPQAMVELHQPAPRREPTPTPKPVSGRVVMPRDIPLRPLLYLVLGLAAVGVLVYLWIQLQSAAAVLRQAEGLAPELSGTPTLPPRMPTPFPIAVASPSPTATPQPSPTPEPSPTAVIAGILVEFTTTAPVYVEAVVDGEEAIAEQLPAGVERSLPLGEDQVIMRVSNVEAVEIMVNGRPQEQPAGTGPMDLIWRR